MSTWQGFQVNCSVGCWYSSDILHSFFCMNSQYLTGCAALKKQKYCILNKKYSKNEYLNLHTKIVQNLKNTNVYGEFFPKSFVPFVYNDTIAQEHYPLNQVQANSLGYQWKEDVKPKTNKNFFQGKNLPETIQEVDESICTQAIHCLKCNQPYKIIKRELELYQQLDIPATRTCPNCRYTERFKRRNPRKLFKRTCQKENCNLKLMSSYSTDRPEIIYCEKHYIKEYN